MAKILPTAHPPSTPWAARKADDEYGATAQPDWRQVDWPAHLHRTRIDDCEINYVDIGEGEGPPIVFVHGLGGQWQNWLENIPRMAEARRVVAIDLPGHGQSGMPSEKITISLFARYVNELCDQLDLGRVVLIGNSMGGFVTAETSVRHPDRVDRLVLVSAAGISTADLKRSPGPVILRVGGMLATFFTARHRKLAARPMTRHGSLALVARHPSLLKADLAYEGLFKGAGKKGFDDALKANLDYDFRDRLPEIEANTLIIWGSNDSILPSKDADEYERLLPQSRKVVLDDTGHIPMVERPGTFNEAVIEFVQGESVGAPTSDEAAEAA